MKILNILSGVVAIGMLFASCGDDFTNSAEASGVTFLPTLTLNGPPNVVLDCNATGYDDPGLSAEESGNELEVVTAISALYFGSADISSPDIYNISYSALNKDGIPGADMREVIFPPCTGDMVTSITGVYTTSIVREGGETHSGKEYVMIREAGDNKYELSHGIGGFYDLGRGFGPLYAAKGAVITFSGGTYTVSDSFIEGFGLDISTDVFTVDAATKTIQYHSFGDFGNGQFDVTLTQVSL